MKDNLDRLLRERLEADPSLAGRLDDIRAELALALDLARRRERLGMTQRELAKWSGIAQPMISRIERATQSPTLPTLLKLLRALHISIVVDPAGEIAMHQAATQVLGVDEPMRLSLRDDAIERIERISFLVEQIIEEGRVHLLDGRSVQSPALLHSSNDGFLALSREGRVWLAHLVCEVRSDPAIAENTRATDVESLLIRDLSRAAAEHGAGRFVARRTALSIWKNLMSDIEDWFVLVSVPGLDMAPGETIELGGMTIGPLTDEVRLRIMDRVTEIGRTTRYGEDGEVGSGLPFVLEQTEELLNETTCWAWGVICGNETSIDRIALERVNSEALNVLRCFAPAILENPDRVSLGQPDAATVRLRLRYQTRPFGEGVGFRQGASRVSDHIPLALTTDDLQCLRDNPAFQRASRVLELDERSDLEQRLYLAMLQFGTASSLEPPEIKLPNYLTALEVLLLQDDERSDHPEKVGARLARLLPDLNPKWCKHEIARLYATRQRPVHRGEKNLRGREVVSDEHVGSARYWAHRAILRALTSSEPEQSHDEFIGRLLPPRRMADRTRPYIFLVARAMDSNGYVATCQDFPMCVGYGRSEKEAQARLKAGIEREAVQRVKGGATVPGPSAPRTNRVEVEVPTDAVAPAEYVAKTERDENRRRQRLLNMGGRSATAEEMAGTLGVELATIDRWREEGSLLALSLEGREIHYPRWQIESGAVTPGLTEVLRELQGVDPWLQAEFLVDPVKGVIERTPMEALRAGHVSQVRAAARLYRASIRTTARPGSREHGA